LKFTIEKIRFTIQNAAFMFQSNALYLKQCALLEVLLKLKTAIFIILA